MKSIHCSEKGFLGHTFQLWFSGWDPQADVLVRPLADIPSCLSLTQSRTSANDPKRKSCRSQECGRFGRQESFRQPEKEAPTGGQDTLLVQADRLGSPTSPSQAQTREAAVEQRRGARTPLRNIESRMVARMPSESSFESRSVGPGLSFVDQPTQMCRNSSSASRTAQY